MKRLIYLHRVYSHWFDMNIQLSNDENYMNSLHHSVKSLIKGNLVDYIYTKRLSEWIYGCDGWNAPVREPGFKNNVFSFFVTLSSCVLP